MIQKNERRSYASDLSDRQWAVIEPLFPRAGNRSKWEKREVVNAVLYFADNGCKWRNLPPRFSTVYNGCQLLLRRNPKRALGKEPRGAGGTGTDRRRTKHRSQLRNHRLTKCKNDLSRRRTRDWRREKQVPILPYVDMVLIAWQLLIVYIRK